MSLRQADHVGERKASAVRTLVAYCTLKTALV